MDLIYHGNCFDGAYASYLMFLLCQAINEDTLSKFINVITLSKQDLSLADPVNCSPKEIAKIVPTPYTTSITLTAFSLPAGEGPPHAIFSLPKRILFVVDTHLGQVDNLNFLAMRYQAIVVIDHHASMDRYNLGQNIWYFWSDLKSASQLVLEFLQRYFNFSHYFDNKFYSNLTLSISHVSSQDLKRNCSADSKSYLLGLYHYGMDLNHHNPNLYTRLMILDPEYVMQKGKNLYGKYLKDVMELVVRAKLIEIQCGKLKGKSALGVEVKDRALASDVGLILSYLSAYYGFENLSVIISPGTPIRLSTRSHQSMSGPLALDLAKQFQGGGHVHASGCKLTQNQFKSAFKFANPPKNIKLSLNVEEIQSIMFMYEGNLPEIEDEPKQMKME